MKFCLQTISFLLACSDFCSCGNKNKFITRIDRLEVCDQSPASPLTIKHLHVTNPPNKNVRITATATIENYTGSIDLECIVQRCLSREALDTCVPFTKLKPINTCALVMLKNMAWTEIIESIDPPFTCPLTHRAELVINEATFDANLFSFFPIDKYYWKSTMKLSFGKEYTMLCVESNVNKFIATAQLN